MKFLEITHVRINEVLRYFPVARTAEFRKVDNDTYDNYYLSHLNPSLYPARERNDSY